MKKIITSLLLVSMLFCCLPVYATETEITQAGGDIQKAEASLTTVLENSFSVRIPKEITIADDESFINIDAKGNLEPDSQITVTCNDTLTLSNDQNAEYSLDLLLYDENFVWSDLELTDIYESKTGDIYCELDDTKAGTYTGVIEFQISLENTAATLLESNFLSEGLGKDYDTIKSDVISISFEQGDLVSAASVLNEDESTTISYYDLSAKQNGSIIAEYNVVEKSLIIKSELPIKANRSLKGLFEDFINVQTIDLSNFDTSKVTSISNMFHNCTSLTTLLLSDDFDTSQVKSMQSMFYNCNALVNVDVSNFDVSNVGSFNTMFCECNALESIDLADWNTDSATNMSAMFRGCNRLTSLDLSGFDTSNVTTLSQMFYECQALNSLKLGYNFETEVVTDMSHTFYNCNALTELDLNDWNVSQVSNMQSMFCGCQNLTSLTLPTIFDASNTIDMSHMFRDCYSLQTIDLSHVVTSSKLTTTAYMFYCEDDSDWIYHAMTSAIMFGDGFNTSGVTNMEYMFGYVDNLVELDLSMFDVSNVVNFGHMFRECRSLAVLDITTWMPKKIQNIECMFKDCESLTGTLNLKNWCFDNVTVNTDAFDNCGANILMDDNSVT